MQLCNPIVSSWICICALHMTILRSLVKCRYLLTLLFTFKDTVLKVVGWGGIKVLYPKSWPKEKLFESPIVLNVGGRGHKIRSFFLREGWLYQIGWKGGGGSFSIRKFILQILGILNRAFWAWNWFKRVISGFRVSFVQQLYWEKSKPDTLWKRHFWIPMLFGPHTSLHICNHIH